MSGNWKPNDLLYRQVHPTHAPAGNPSSQAFNPTPKDQEKLSVDDAGLVTAEGSWNHFTKNLGFQSAGTWAVSFEEIEASGDLVLLRNPVDVPANPSINNPAHCLIDFNKLPSKGQKKRRAQELAIKASARGCQFQPPA
ncbi:MAG: hypothetical protein WCO57_00895 [Verrucomicrobiota bacterium]